MDGLLVVDKPVGPTSHDVVARVRRSLGERRIGHTGTLDPMASGVLVLLLGRATRLARFMGADEKTYEATVRLGVRTDTFDAQGEPAGPAYDGPWPSQPTIEAALDTFRGAFLQQPPAYSAKKIGGQRAYALARAHAHGGHDAPAPRPAAVPVVLRACAVTGCDGNTVALTLTCSAGFYVRSLASDLGDRLGTGGHLAALRRTRSGEATVDRALPLQTVEAAPDRATHELLPLSGMLTHLPAATLTPSGLDRVRHGARVGPADIVGARFALPAGPAAVPVATDDGRPLGDAVRLMAPNGDLVAMAQPAREGATVWLQPSVVLT